VFAQRHPERVARLALDAFVWTGEGSPTLAERKKKLPDFIAKNRRPIDNDPLRSMYLHDGWFASSTNKGAAVIDSSFCC
jgi:pimeloyl-ACP methyl ester carboxylesterase